MAVERPPRSEAAKKAFCSPKGTGVSLDSATTRKDSAAEGEDSTRDNEVRNEFGSISHLKQQVSYVHALHTIDAVNFSYSINERFTPST